MRAETAGARVITACLRAAQAWTNETGQPANLVFLRVALYDYWERPRLQDRQDFSRDYLWSPGARALYAGRLEMSGRARTQSLRRDHALPLKALWAGLLEGEITEERVTQALLTSIDVRIVTHAEHVRISSLQRLHPPTLGDAWAAYDAAGLDRSGFRHRDDVSDLSLP